VVRRRGAPARRGHLRRGRPRHRATQWRSSPTPRRRPTSWPPRRSPAAGSASRADPRLLPGRRRLRRRARPHGRRGGGRRPRHRGAGTGRLRGIEVDLGAMSDTAQTLAAVAVFAEGPTRITGIGFIRAKETDRIAAVVTELRRLGIDAREEPDGLVVHPGRPSPGVVATYDDHRMAMSFALLGLVVPASRSPTPGASPRPSRPTSRCSSSCGVAEPVRRGRDPPLGRLAAGWRGLRDHRR
jgi:hypothetical protein